MIATPTDRAASYPPDDDRPGAAPRKAFLPPRLATFGAEPPTRAAAEAFRRSLEAAAAERALSPDEARALERLRGGAERR